MNSSGISKKIKSFAHGEDNKKDNTDIDKIERKMKKLLHPTKGFELTKVEVDESFPKYILDNISYYDKWIAK